MGNSFYHILHVSVAASSEKGKKYMNNEKHTVLFKKKKKRGIYLRKHNVWRSSDQKRNASEVQKVIMGVKQKLELTVAWREKKTSLPESFPFFPPLHQSLSPAEKRRDQTSPSSENW